MIGTSRWTRGELVGLAAGLLLFALLEGAYLNAPIAASAPDIPAGGSPSHPIAAIPGTPFEGEKNFLDAQFWIFTRSHSDLGLGVTHGLPVWQVHPDGTLAVHNSHPPTVALLEYAAAWVVGPTPVAARLPALIFSILMVLGMYLLLRRAFPRLAVALGVISLVAQPLFFHFATCPEVFLLGHLPLLALLFVAAEPAGTPAASGLPRRRLAGLAVLSGLCVAVSYATLGVLALWLLGWCLLRRNRAALLDATAVLIGAALSLSLLLLWLKWGGGSVAHWAERGALRSFGIQADRPDLDAAATVTWSALFDHLWIWLFTNKGNGWMAWLGLIGVGLGIAGFFRKPSPVEPAVASAPIPTAEPTADAPDLAPAPAATVTAAVTADPLTNPLMQQKILLTAFSLMFLVEAILIRQNALTHAYSVASGGFLISFGLSAIGEQGQLGFQSLGLRRGFNPRYLMGILLTITALGALYRVAEQIDAQVDLTSQNDMTALATAVDRTQAQHPAQPVLVYPDWLLPARTVTGTDRPQNEGYIFPWFYRGRAFLCYRQPGLNPAEEPGNHRPAVILWPARVPLAPAVAAELQTQGYQAQTVGGVTIYSLPVKSP